MSTRRTRASGAMASPLDSLDDLLTEALLLRALAQAPARTEGFLGLALVCRRWRGLLFSGLTSLTAPQDAELDEAELLAQLTCFPSLTSLTLHKGSVFNPSSAFLSEVGQRCPGLRHFRLQARPAGPPYHWKRWKRWSRWKFSPRALSGLFRSCPSLTSLSLPGGCLDTGCIPSSISSLSGLRELSVYNCLSGEKPYTRLPASAAHLRGLKSLTIWDPMLDSRVYPATLDSLPEPLSLLSGLESLCLSCPSLKLLGTLSTLSLLSALSLRAPREHGWMGALGQAFPFPALRELTINMGNQECILPESLGLLPRLRLLHCLSCRGVVLPPSLGALPTLRDLSLDNNKLPCKVLMPGFANHFSCLTSLHLKAFSFCLPALLSRLPALRRLSLQKCTLRGVRTLFANGSVVWSIRLNHSRLRELCLEDCEAANFNLQFDASGLKALRSFKGDLRRPVILIPSIRPENQPHLETLSISWHCSCEDLPLHRTMSTSYGFKALKSLSLSGIHLLEALPASLCGLSSLQELSLQVLLKLTHLPAALGGECCPGCSAGAEGSTGQCLPGCVPGLVSLRKLKLECLLKLGSLPTSLGKLKALEELLLTKCPNVSNVAEVLLELEGLRVLTLESANLSMQGARSPDLKVLKLYVSDFPSAATEMPSLSEFARLQELTLLNCRSLGTSIFALLRLALLRVLNCYNLATLPAELGALQQLQKLELRSLYALTSLPESLGDLHGLRDLVLDNLRALEALPLSLNLLTGLRTLVVEYCDSLKACPLRLENFPRLEVSCQERLQEELIPIGPGGKRKKHKV